MMGFLAPMMYLFIGILIIPIEIVKFNIMALTKLEKQARFGSVFETIKLGSARLAG